MIPTALKSAYRILVDDLTNSIVRRTDCRYHSTFLVKSNENQKIKSCIFYIFILGRLFILERYMLGSSKSHLDRGPSLELHDNCKIDLELPYLGRRGTLLANRRISSGPHQS